MSQCPADTKLDDSRTPGRRMICERCATEFQCSRDDRGGCWCAAEPYRLPTPLPAEVGHFTDCLCPSCLRKIAERLMESRGTQAPN
jgi:Cysteine-rich CWC